jgi:MFS family permease
MMDNSESASGPAASEPRASDQVLANLRHNLFAVVLFEFTWGIGLSFVLYIPMVPAYLTVLGAPKTLIGLLQAVWTIATPLQLLSSTYLAGRNRLRNTMLLYAGAVLCRLLYGIVAVTLGIRWSGPGVLWSFVLGCFGLVGLITLAQPLYLGIMTDNVPRDRRGRLYGFRAFGLGIGGMLTAAVASWVLHRWPSPMNYRLSFLIGDSVLLVSCFSLALFRDRVDREMPARGPNLAHALREKLEILLGNPNYRLFLFFHLLNVSGASIAAFVVPFAKERLQISDSSVATFSVIFLGTNAVMGLVVGRIADRFGYRVVGIIQSSLLLCFFLTVVSARSFPVICVAYGMYATVSMSLLLVLCNMSLELCPQLSAIDLTALGSTIILPVVGTVPPLAGAIIDLTSSYLSVFFVGATIAFIALMGFAALVREPRSGRLYVVRQIPMR